MAEPGSVQSFRQIINGEFERRIKRNEVGSWDGLVLDVRSVPVANLQAFLQDLQMNGTSTPNKTNPDKAAQ